MESPTKRGVREAAKQTKHAKVATRGGGYPSFLVVKGRGGIFLSLFFGGTFSHKLDHIWPN